VLTLLLVPALYLIVVDIKSFSRRLLGLNSGNTQQSGAAK
jgi:hypothetical protein